MEKKIIDDMITLQVQKNKTVNAIKNNKQQMEFLATTNKGLIEELKVVENNIKAKNDELTSFIDEGCNKIMNGISPV